MTGGRKVRVMPRASDMSLIVCHQSIPVLHLHTDRACAFRTFCRFGPEVRLLDRIKVFRASGAVSDIVVRD